MKSVDCAYCGKPNALDRDRCEFCNGVLEKPRPDGRDGVHFAYNGYVVWRIRCENALREEISWYFYRGDRLIEIITLPRVLLEQIFNDPGANDFGKIFELFLVAQGEQEVMRVVEQDKKYPATFEIKRIENATTEYFRSLTWEDVRRAVAAGEKF